jgi:hypothetical protein
LNVSLQRKNFSQKQTKGKEAGVLGANSQPISDDAVAPMEKPSRGKDFDRSTSPVRLHKQLADEAILVLDARRRKVLSQRPMSVA